MALTLELTDGTTTVDLNAPNDVSVVIGGLEAPPPPLKASYSGGNFSRDGQQLQASSYNNRVVTAMVRFRGANNTLATNLRNTFEILRKAKDFAQKGIGSQVQLKYQRDSGTTYFFNVVQGDVNLGNFLTSYIGQEVVMNAVIVLEAEPFALGNSETIENYVRDPSFEVAGTALADWTENIDATVTTARDTTQSKWGNASLKLVMTNSSASGEVVERTQSLGDVDAAETWSFGMWVYFTATSNTKVVMDIEYTGGGSTSTKEVTAVNTGFTLIKLDNETVPASTTAAVFKCRLESTAASATGTCYIDNVIAVPLAAVPDTWVSSYELGNHNDDNAQLHTNTIDMNGMPGDVMSDIQVKITENEAHTALWVGARHAGRQYDAGLFIEGEDFATWSDEPSDANSSGAHYGEISPGPNIDAVSSGSNTSATSLTVSHTVTLTGIATLLVVSVCARDIATVIPTGVTYNAVALTKLGDITKGTEGASIWYLASPATGANNIVATWGGTMDAMALCGISYTNAPTVPTNYAERSGNGNPNVPVTSGNATSICQDAMSKGQAVGTLSAGADQTARMSLNVGGLLSAGCSTEIGGGTRTFTWSEGPAVDWAAGGCSIDPFAVMTSAATPRVMTKTISTPPEGLYNVIARMSNPDAANWGVAAGYQYGDITKDPGVAGEFTDIPTTNTTFIIYDLGTLTIPPVVTPAGMTVGDFIVRLAVYQKSGSDTDQLRVDWVQLLSIGEGSAYTTKTSAADVDLVDSRGPETGITLLNSSDVVQSRPAGQMGEPPKCHPDGTRLTIVSDDGAADIDDGCKVSVTVRPAYLAVI